MIGTLAAVLLAVGDAREPIVVVDTGVPIKRHESFCKIPGIAAGQASYDDTIGHATHIAEIIYEKLDAKKYCLFFVKVFYFDAKRAPNGEYFDMHFYLGALEYLKPKVVNLSFTGSFDLTEATTLKKLAASGTVFYIAAGNGSLNLSDSCAVYPACYRLPNSRIVEALDQNNKRAIYSNYGGPVNRKFYGRYKNAEGTSLATPRVLVNELSR